MLAKYSEDQPQLLDELYLRTFNIVEDLGYGVEDLRISSFGVSDA